MVRLMPSASASSRSAGSRTPSASRPSASRPRTAAASAAYSGRRRAGRERPATAPSSRASWTPRTIPAQGHSPANWLFQPAELAFRLACMAAIGKATAACHSATGLPRRLDPAVRSAWSLYGVSMALHDRGASRARPVGRVPPGHRPAHRAPLRHGGDHRRRRWSCCCGSRCGSGRASARSATWSSSASPSTARSPCCRRPTRWSAAGRAAGRRRRAQRRRHRRSTSAPGSAPDRATA